MLHPHLTHEVHIYQIFLFAIDFQEEVNPLESLNPQLLSMGSDLERSLSLSLSTMGK